MYFYIEFVSPCERYRHVMPTFHHEACFTDVVVWARVVSAKFSSSLVWYTIFLCTWNLKRCQKINYFHTRPNNVAFVVCRRLHRVAVAKMRRRQADLSANAGTIFPASLQKSLAQDSKITELKKWKILLFDQISYTFCFQLNDWRHESNLQERKRKEKSKISE